MAPRHERRARLETTEVLDRTDLADLLDELTQPAGRPGPGRRWHCPLPEHDAHHASVTMSRARPDNPPCRWGWADHRGRSDGPVAVALGAARPDGMRGLATRAGMMPDRPVAA